MKKSTSFIVVFLGLSHLLLAAAPTDSLKHWLVGVSQAFRGQMSGQDSAALAFFKNDSVLVPNTALPENLYAGFQSKIAAKAWFKAIQTQFEGSGVYHIDTAQVTIIKTKKGFKLSLTSELIALWPTPPKRHLIQQAEVWQLATTRQGYLIEGIEVVKKPPLPSILIQVATLQTQLQGLLLQMAHQPDSTWRRAWQQAAGPDSVYIQGQPKAMSISNWSKMGLSLRQLASLRWVAMDIEQCQAPQQGKASQWSVKHIVWKDVNLQANQAQWYQDRSEYFETFDALPKSKAGLRVQKITVEL